MELQVKDKKKKTQTLNSSESNTLSKCIFMLLITEIQYIPLKTGEISWNSNVAQVIDF